MVRWVLQIFVCEQSPEMLLIFLFLTSLLPLLLQYNSACGWPCCILLLWPTSIGCDRHWLARETWPVTLHMYELACLPSALLRRAVLTEINKRVVFALMSTECVMMKLHSVSHLEKMKLHSVSHLEKFQRCRHCVIIKFVDTDEPLIVCACGGCDLFCECFVLFRPFQVPALVVVSDAERLTLGYFLAAYCGSPCDMLTDHTLDLPVDACEEKESCCRQASAVCKLCMRQSEARQLLLLNFFCRIHVVRFSVSESVHPFIIIIFPLGLFSSWGRPWLFWDWEGLSWFPWFFLCVKNVCGSGACVILGAAEVLFTSVLTLDHCLVQPTSYFTCLCLR